MVWLHNAFKELISKKITLIKILNSGNINFKQLLYPWYNFEQLQFKQSLFKQLTQYALIHIHIFWTVSYSSKEARKKFEQF